MTSKNEKIEMPPNWIRTTLGNVSEIILGQSPPSETYNETKLGLPFYQGKAEFGQYYPKPIKWCSSPKKIAIERDVLISVRAPVGPTNVCPETSCIGRGLAAIRPLSEIPTKFILYLLRNSENILSGQGTGSTFNAISGSVLEEFELNLPPLNEQMRIVDKVDSLFSKLDSGIESLKKVKSLIKQYRQSVLKAAFEGKLTEKWRDQNKGKIEPVSSILSKDDFGIQKEKRKQEESQLEELFNIPKEWIWTSVGKISEKIHYGYTASAEDKPIGPRMLRITDIQNNKVNWDKVPFCEISSEEKPKYLLNDGDLVFARTGATVGKSFLIKGDFPEAVFASYLIRIILNKSFIKEYVYFYFQSLYYWQQIKKGQIGIGQPNVNSQVLSKIFLPIPSKQEQIEIVKRIELYFDLIDNIENTVEETTKQGELLRQSILKKAFEGRLVPQDPNDEPAEKLIERIKAEKIRRETENKQKIKRFSKIKRREKSI